MWSVDRKSAAAEHHLSVAFRVPMKRHPVLVSVPFADPVGVEPMLIAGAGRECRRGIVGLLLLLWLLVRAASERCWSVRRDPRWSVVRLVAPHHRQRVMVVVGIYASTGRRSHVIALQGKEWQEKRGW